ncbi:MAG TPA: Asp-tRNA(Asn)/Glu-tRNA(Gln) amidotransferase subunit GatC [Planktothrix sp.]|jgi:aspartyl-tRNA(Asn)/glutamyl-tRNA(Gln) amidotransferase subunit C
MPITSETVEHVAKLARLSLTEEEKKLYSEQLAKIIGYFDELANVDTTGIEPMSHALPLINVMREDIVEPPPGHEMLLKTAPEREGAFFKVPKIGD